ncbi:threonine aldolase family protein [Leucobacter celer]|uniref:threonine aldolase family protein n=1 Tax=Leucobacter celer TaxID=668625 RepID=UPI0006A7BACB|nr:GntG family PLP-dependent aldolase [Leucobacter celer]
MIDLRSDTCSRPTDAMRQAIATAVVGDDVYSDDPTVKELEAETARLLGKEDAVYMPTGTMTNQVGIRAHTEPGDAVLFEQSAHVYALEGGAPSAISGVLPRLIPGQQGLFTADQVTEFVGAPHPFFPSTIPSPVTLLCAENTHNNGGGTIWPLDQLTDVAETAKHLGLAAHLDGARLWHATAATGILEADYAAPFDTVSVCFSKALGAPIGSCLAGPKELMDRARRFKQGFGGGFRQAGIIAAGALHALYHHRELLPRTHELAQRFATGLTDIDGVVIDPAAVHTNIVRYRLDRASAATFVDQLHERGLWMLPTGADSVRAVFYLDITEQDVDQSLGIIRDVMATIDRTGATAPVTGY